MTILVCGGAGFIGSNFIRSIFKKYRAATVVNLDKLTYSGNLDNTRDFAGNGRYFFVRGDIADRKAVERVFKRFNPDYLVNFAAETHVDRSIHAGTLEFVRTNVEGVFNLLEAVRASKKIKKYVQVSTDEVYGSLKTASDTRFTEQMRFAPNNPYSATKASGDLLCRAYHSTWRVPVVVTHCSNNYGPHQDPEKLIPFFVLRMLENKKMPLYGDGKNVRDWIHVLDHCDALERCLFDGKPGEEYNIGADNEIGNVTIAKMIAKHFGRDSAWIEFVADRPGHDRRYAIDAAKIRRELGWKPKYRFAAAFRETVDWYIHHMKWINKSRKKHGVPNPHITV